MNKSLYQIYDDLKMGITQSLDENLIKINDYIVHLLKLPSLNSSQVDELRVLIGIGNITYNNMDKEPPIEDGIYDMMLECYRKYDPNNSYPVGAIPVSFANDTTEIAQSMAIPIFRKMDRTELSYERNMMFPNIIHDNALLDFDRPRFENDFNNNQYISKRLHDTQHNHPDLVGTFDKCKFVLNAQADAVGVLNDSNVAIVERDFFMPLLREGIISPTEELCMIATIKYDGISVEADCSNTLHSARTRGDTGMGVASDITPILSGYRFNDSITEINGIKFEAIIDKYNLARLNLSRKDNYVNCRMAIIGIMNSSDALNYADYITLVPIATDIKDANGNPLDRLVELEFLNKYYAKDEFMRFNILKGDYPTLLYKMKRFVEEAEYAREQMPFMYDGVVFEFYDPKIRRRLGRDNYIDRYKVAVKFNPMKKESIFTGYTYSIGQDGSITPMCHFKPVEFMGTIHNKTTAHSYKRFKELDLRVGDPINLQYVNDVIVYVTKSDKINPNNPKRLYSSKDQFPDVCPECGCPIFISNSGDSAYCTNMGCPGIVKKRMVNMISKLGIVNFGESTIQALPYSHLWQLLEASKDPENFKAVLGPNERVQFAMQLQQFLNKPVKDFKVMGALGFTSIAEKTWKVILAKLSLKEIYEYYASGDPNNSNLRQTLINIKGVGPVTIDTILMEMKYFLSDVKYILDNMELVTTSRRVDRGVATPFLSLKKTPVIRFSHCRDKELCAKLESMGCDADDSAGVTKDTTVLLIPYPECPTSSKIRKAQQYAIPIVPIEEFKNNMMHYL